MKPKFPRPLLFLASFLIQALPSSANTEIINLTPTIGPRIPALDSTSSNWPVLTPIRGQNERRWSMTHVAQKGDSDGCIGRREEWCEDDLWLVLDFDADEWSAYKSFTLRISWPASVCVCPERSSPFLGSNLCFCFLTINSYASRCIVIWSSTRLISSWRHIPHKATLSKLAITLHGLLILRLPIPKPGICTLG
jgi:hypothetical protein